MLKDQLSRPLRDLRISVTDRCNYRCNYCMPGDRTYEFLPRKELLAFEELTDLCKLFTHYGVKKLRITGGEPLLRRDLPDLIAMLAGIEGIDDIAMTTNGLLLSRFAQALYGAGLNRVTVSLDSLDPKRYSELIGKPVGPKVVLEAVETAAALGLKVKVNTVVQKGVNHHEVPAIANYFKDRGITVRFIEFMDVGNVNAWQMDQVYSGSQILADIAAEHAVEPVDPNYEGEVARRYRYLDGSGEFGLITSVTRPFCRGCNRARLSADGELFTCLFANQGHDLKHLLRRDGLDAVGTAIERIWGNRQDRYSEERGSLGVPRDKVEMFKIGG